MPLIGGEVLIPILTLWLAALLSTIRGMLLCRIALSLTHYIRSIEILPELVSRPSTETGKVQDSYCEHLNSSVLG